MRCNITDCELGKICEPELNRKHDNIKSKISDTEFICRAAYEMHYNSKDKPFFQKMAQPKNSLVDKKALVNDALSFWRIVDVEKSTLNKILDKIVINDPMRKPIIALCHPKIKRVRELQVPPYNGRMFHVIDDCRTSETKYDSDHCTVGMCKKQIDKIEKLTGEDILEGCETNDDNDLLKIRAYLVKFLKRNMKFIEEI